MSCLLAAFLSVAAAAPSASGSPQTFFLDYVPAGGMLDLLDRMVREHSSLAEPLRPYWEALRPAVRADPGTNSVRASGSAEALSALGKVVKGIDVPRAGIDISYQCLQVKDLTALLGSPAGPPMPRRGSDDGSAPPLSVRVATGDWSARVATLLRDGAMAVVREGEVKTVDGLLGTAYIGNPEAPAPEFLLQVEPLLMADKTLWLNVVFGEVTRERRDAGAPAPSRDAPPCPCSLGLGDLRFLPKVTVLVHVGEGQSVLLSGLRWRVGKESLRAPTDEFLLLVPRVTPPTTGGAAAKPE